MVSNKSLARIAGAMYLVVAVLGGFAEYTRSSALDEGSAQATAANVAAHAIQFQVAFAADLAVLPFFLAVGVMLYAILKAVNLEIAVAMLVINAVSVAIQAINMLSHAGALLVATDPALTAGFSSASSQAFVLDLLEMHRVGYLIAQIFFGLYLLPLGYLVYRSNFFPKLFAAILAAGCAGYLAGVVAAFASFRLESSASTYFGMVGGLAEMAFLAWLIIRGASPADQARASVAPMTTKGALTWKA